MLLAEDRIEILVDRLRELENGDRHAVLRRLTGPERKQVLRLLASTSPPAMTALPYSPELAERLLDWETHPALAPAARKALGRIMARLPVASPTEVPPRSLLNVLGGWLGLGG